MYQKRETKIQKNKNVPTTIFWQKKNEERSKGLSRFNVLIHNLLAEKVRLDVFL